MKISNTVQNTKLATYSIDLPNAHMKGMPCPAGTGFFVSADGWFATAAHVVTSNGAADGPVRTDVESWWLSTGGNPGEMGICKATSIDWVSPGDDFALIKCDFGENCTNDHLAGKDGFPHLTVSQRRLELGEDAYAFGFPLPESSILSPPNSPATVGFSSHSPRVTSAIVSSLIERTTMVVTGAEPHVYVLDKALNYGNSGGPIVATATGNVHAWCSRFQPVFIPQHHLKDAQGRAPSVMIPSLYGVVGSLSSPNIVAALVQRGIEIVPA